MEVVEDSAVTASLGVVSAERERARRLVSYLLHGELQKKIAG
jgi:hypothetical protein